MIAPYCYKDSDNKGKNCIYIFICHWCNYRQNNKNIYRYKEIAHTSVLTAVRTLVSCVSRKLSFASKKTRYGANKSLAHRAQGREQKHFSFCRG